MMLTKRLWQLKANRLFKILGKFNKQISINLFKKVRFFRVIKKSRF